MWRGLNCGTICDEKNQNMYATSCFNININIYNMSDTFDRQHLIFDKETCRCSLQEEILLVPAEPGSVLLRDYIVLHEVTIDVCDFSVGAGSLWFTATVSEWEAW